MRLPYIPGEVQQRQELEGLLKAGAKHRRRVRRRSPGKSGPAAGRRRQKNLKKNSNSHFLTIECAKL